MNENDDFDKVRQKIKDMEGYNTIDSAKKAVEDGFDEIQQKIREMEITIEPSEFVDKIEDDTVQQIKEMEGGKTPKKSIDNIEDDFNKIQDKVIRLEAMEQTNVDGKLDDFDKIQKQMEEISMKEPEMESTESYSKPIHNDFEKMQNKVKHMENTNIELNSKATPNIQNQNGFDKIQIEMEQPLSNQKKVTFLNDADFDRLQNKIRQMEGDKLDTLDFDRIQIREMEDDTISPSLLVTDETFQKIQKEPQQSTPAYQIQTTLRQLEEGITDKSIPQAKIESNTTYLPSSSRASLQQLENEIISKSANNQIIQNEAIRQELQLQLIQERPDGVSNRNRSVSYESWLPGDELEDVNNICEPIVERQESRNYIIEGEDEFLGEAIIGVTVDPVIEGDVIDDQEYYRTHIDDRRMKRTIVRCIYRGIICFILVVIIVTVPIVTSRNNKLNATPMPASSAPSFAPSVQPTTELFIEYQEYLYTVFNNTAVYKKNSPQYHALYWIYHTDDTPLDNTNFLQRYILAVFYYSTNGNQWSYCNALKTCYVNGKYNWLSDFSECEWYGNTCKDTHITKIQLGTTDGNNLVGTLPPELFHLTQLQYIDFQNNKLSSTIPSTIGKLKSSLEFLILYNNSLTTPFPDELFELQKIQEMLLYGNAFKGSIDGRFGNLVSLLNLNLQDNLFSGSIPSELRLLGNLTELILNQNKLNGTFPEEILTSNTKLQKLYYGNNTNITGTLYTNIGYTVPNLIILSVMNCDLTGSIPESIFELQDLQILSLENNRFTGSVSSRFGSLSRLNALILAGNEFYGSIPTEIGNIPHINTLRLHENNLTGVMPLSICSKRGVGGFNLEVLTADCAEDDGNAPKVTCTCCTECF